MCQDKPELCHFGVLGTKWGQHKSIEQTAYSIGAKLQLL